MSIRAMAARNRQRLFPFVTFLVLAGVAFAFRGPLIAWFTLQPTGNRDASTAVSSQAGGLAIEASIAPDPPRQNGNTLWLEVRDSQGNPIEAAEVEVVYRMPAMGSMPEMRGEARVAAKEPGRFRADFDLPMGGSWTLEVAIRSKASRGTARYSMTVGSKGLTSVSSQPSARSAPAGVPQSVFRFTDPVLPEVEASFAAYDKTRELLARGHVRGLATASGAVAKSLRKALAKADREPPGVADCLQQAAKAADRLSKARNLEQARGAFAELSRFVMAMASADHRLQHGRQAFECPMAPGFSRWFQRAGVPGNPYQTNMVDCVSRTEWLPGAATT